MRLLPATTMIAFVLTGVVACAPDDVTLDTEASCARLEGILTQAAPEFRMMGDLMREAGADPAKASALAAAMRELYSSLGDDFEELAAQTTDTRMKQLLTEAAAAERKGVEAVTAAGDDVKRLREAKSEARFVLLLKGHCNQ